MLKARIEFAKFLQDTAKEMDQVVEVYWNGGPRLTADNFFQETGRVSLQSKPHLMYVGL